MYVYHDEDASLEILETRRIAVIGYGNQGRAQALNLRDSGLDVFVGNRDDEYAHWAQEDGFAVLPISEAASLADVIMILIPDEVTPGVFRAGILPQLGAGEDSQSDRGKALVFASGYSIAFGFIAPPPRVDILLVAPRMIGAGVRDLYVAGRGFPSFIGVAQDHSGQTKEIALALAKGIGSTRMGVVEVTFRQEAELDLFTEQCFGPAFGHVLTSAVDLLLEAGYPPEAVLLELYMSGELAYTLGKIAELGMVEQAALHSPTSQYGSMSRGMRFILPELRTKMLQGLEEIQTGRFAEEWAAEQEAGLPTLAALREAARSLPLHKHEQELLHALGKRGGSELSSFGSTVLSRAGPDRQGPQQTTLQEPGYRAAATDQAHEPEAVDLVALIRDTLRRLTERLSRRWPKGAASAEPDADQGRSSGMAEVLAQFLVLVRTDPALNAYSRGRDVTTHYELKDAGLEFYIRFSGGQVSADWGPPEEPAQVRLQTTAEVLDGMFTGRINAMRAFMTGKLAFSGEPRLAIGIQQIQENMKRLYGQAQKDTVARSE